MSINKTAHSKVRGFALTCMIFLMLSANVCGHNSEDELQWMERGSETLMPFKKSLMGALKAGLAQGNTAAVQACQLMAPRIQSAQSTEQVVVGRTSHKLRNQNNSPEDWLKPVLDDYVDGSYKKHPRILEINDEELAYVEPIYLQPKCSNCHGNNISQELKAQIDKLYPSDKAIGFSVGDFRGLFWVKFASEKESTK